MRKASLQLLGIATPCGVREHLERFLQIRQLVAIERAVDLDAQR